MSAISIEDNHMAANRVISPPECFTHTLDGAKCAIQNVVDVFLQKKEKGMTYTVLEINPLPVGTLRTTEVINKVTTQS